MVHIATAIRTVVLLAILTSVNSSSRKKSGSNESRDLETDASWQPEHEQLNENAHRLFDLLKMADHGERKPNPPFTRQGRMPKLGSAMW